MPGKSPPTGRNTTQQKMAFLHFPLNQDTRAFAERSQRNLRGRTAYERVSGIDVHRSPPIDGTQPERSDSNDQPPRKRQKIRLQARGFSHGSSPASLVHSDRFFNPQALVCQCGGLASQIRGRAAEAAIQGVYVSTRARPSRLRTLLAEISSCSPSLFILPSKTIQDLPVMSGIPRFMEVLDYRHPAVSMSLRNLESFHHPVFSVDQNQWDLPSKRNFALWHAVQCGYRYILLLDDDIRGITPSLLSRAGEALANHSIVGAFVTDFPDTSIIGHVERAIGIEVYPFMSGSCLFIDVESACGPFPAIYNEDWLFMAPHIDRRRACSLGCIRQAASNPFNDPKRALFQEPGELIADSLFEMLGVGAYDKRFERSVWGNYLSARRNWLNELSQRVVDRRHEEVIIAARACLAQITPQDCVDYMGVLERDQEAWRLFLHGSM